LQESKKLITQERYCEKHFSQTVSRRKATERFIVRLPKNEAIAIGESKSQALRRFNALRTMF